MAVLESKRDAADVAAYDRAQRALAAGEDEFVAPEFAARLIAGESPLRVWREARGLTGKALAAATGLSAPYLSQIETGERDGSLAAMKKIADALRISLDDLVAAKHEE